MRTSKAALVCAGIVFVAALLLYSWTLAPTVTLVDSGELILAAHSLGVAHPPGFPLYVVLAHLASLVPIGSVATRVNFASALFAALGSGMLTLVATELMITTPPLATGKRPGIKKTPAHARTVAGFFILAPALGAGLLFATSRTFWSYSTIAEVYTLNTLLILCVIFLMLEWRRREFGSFNHDAFLYAAASIFGLALGVHHVTVALILPALALLVYRAEGARFFGSRRLLFAAVVAVGSMIMVYSYLPLAASHGILNWGTPRSLREIWWHISGRQYQSFFSFSPELLGRQLLDFIALAFRQFGPWWLPLAPILAIAGFVYAWRTEGRIFWFLALLVLTNLAYTLGYDIEEDKDAYYLPVFVAFALAIAFGVRSLVEFCLPKKTLRARAYILAGSFILLLPAIAVTRNWAFNNRRHDFIAQDYVENIQSTIAPDGLLLTLDWQVQAPMLYTREIEQRRHDVKVVDINLLRRSWYFDYLSRAYPEMVERSRVEINLFVAELKQWERDPEVYRKDQGLAQKIESAFHQMLRSFVTQESKVAPVYVTSEVIFHATGSESALTTWLMRNFQLIPRGLVFELTSKGGFHDPGEIHLQTRGLADGTRHFENNDVVMIKVIPAYTQMLEQRGRYLAFFDQHDRAIAVFEQVLALDPNSKSAQLALSESRNKLPVAKPLPP